MDKNVLKKFAIESRQELMEKVANKINRYFVDEEFNVNQNGEVYVLVNDKHTLRLTKSEYENRQLLVKRIKEITLEQVIEEAAYTWFNRIIAIRYMEIHDYLPLTKDNQSLGVRVLSSKDNTPDPEIMKISNLINPDLDIEFNKEYYGTIQDNNKRFEYILLLVCKKLGKVIPQVFDGVTDYIDILIPDNLLNESGYVTKLLNDVAEENFKQVEIIGWLYQYYISEKKDEVFSDLKKNIKIKKENIPSATQIFTPEWIVKYMVENTIGQYASMEFRKKLKYYIFNENEANITKDIKELKILDPCCGSGHILVYVFELLYNIYLEKGYNKKDIIELIFNNNIYGLDIDDRAGQLSVLSVLLKAREYDKNLFNNINAININIMSIQESINIKDDILDDLNNSKDEGKYLIDTFRNAKDIGSLLIMEEKNYEELENEILSNNTIFGIELQRLIPLIKVAKILSKKFDVVVTNPPYMGMSGMNPVLSKYVFKYYEDVKTDLFSAFIKRCQSLTIENGFYSLITQPSWLHLKSFEELRKNIIEKQKIISLLHMGRGIFGIDFGSTAFVIKNETSKEDYLGNYFKLFDRTFQYIDIKDIEGIFLKSKEDINYEYDFTIYNVEESNTELKKNLQKIHFKQSQMDFSKITGYPIVYNASDKVINLFKQNKTFKEKFDARIGLSTGNNNIFVRNWFEVNYNNIGFGMTKEEAKNSKLKWFPYNKGGDYKKWYGNNDWIVNWKDDGKDIKEYIKHKNPNVARGEINYFKESISTSAISSVTNSYRLYPKGAIFDVNFRSIFVKEDEKYFVLALMNSKVINHICKLLSPTMALNMYDIDRFPIIELNSNDMNMINQLTYNCFELAKDDWNSDETSYEFERIELLKLNYDTISKAMNEIETQYNNRRQKMQENETEIDNILIKNYSLDNELDAKCSDNDVTLKRFDQLEEIKKFISYFVGCLFGRYSLDEDGLVYAGGEFNKTKYKTFEVDVDNIIPLTENNYFGDDIVSRFKKFIEVVYGKETLYENLDFIAETLGKRSGENSEETIRRYFINDFYNDHVKMYQKRPIYWLFDSGKKNGFKCLIYMHRYNEGLVSRIRLDYLHRMQNTYEKELKEIADKLNNDVDLTSKRELSKRQADISAKLQETNEYDEKIAHIADQRIKIDLDDGVVVNYAKFSVKNPKTGKDESILAKIK